jgi:hypothetical protein
VEEQPFMAGGEKMAFSPPQTLKGGYLCTLDAALKSRSSTIAPKTTFVRICVEERPFMTAL